MSDPHDPPCADWLTHIQVAVDALKPTDFPRLRDFVVEVEGTWDDERLAADPEAPVRRDWPLKWDDIKRAKGAPVCMIPDCGCTGYAHA